MTTGTNYILIFGKAISFYSIIGSIGLMAALFLCLKRRKRYGIEKEDVINLAAYSIIGIIVGSKLMALICMVPQFIEYWQQIEWSSGFLEKIMGQGFVFYGGLIGVIAAFYIYCRQFKLPFGKTMELAAPAVPLFHFFGRLGCYTAGCCGGIGGFPLQLVEASGNMIIFALIIYIQNKHSDFSKTFPLYLLLYGCMRFVLEFFRGDPERGFIGALSVSQWISLIAAVIAIRLLINKRIIFTKNT